MFADTNRALPDARLIASKLPADPVLSGLNAWFSFFGQFVGNDLAHTVSGPYSACECGSEDPECLNIKTSNDDLFITKGEQECIPFPRSTDVKLAFECNFKNREQFTRGTHFLDMDNLYGSTSEGQRMFRAYKNGELKHDVSVLTSKLIFN
jgi:hypothetical protein